MRRRSPACDVLGPNARIKAYELVQKDQGLGRVLTAHGKGWGLGAATPAAGLSGGSRTALVEVGAAGRSGLLGSADRLVVRQRRCTNGQGGRSIHSREKSRWRSHLPVVVLGVESGACRALGRGRRARGETWGSDGAISGVVEARGAVEGRVRGGAEPLRRRGRLECVARVRAAADGRRSVGEAGDPFIGLRRRSWACVPQRERPPGISA